jgi:hypothetical protein
MRGFFLLLFFLVLLALTQVKAQTPPPRRFPSMMLSNWVDLMGTWSGARDNPNQGPKRPVGLTGLRSSFNNWAFSSLSVDSFALKFGNTLYSDPSLVSPQVFSSINNKPKHANFFFFFFFLKKTSTHILVVIHS